MKILSKIMMAGASVLLLSGVADAGETTVYDLRVRDNFILGNQFSVDKDEEPWKWGNYSVDGQDFSGPEQYESSYTDGYYSSAFYTPELNLAAGTYKVYTKPRKRNSDYTTPQAADLRILLGQGDMTESAYVKGNMKEVGTVSEIKYASTYSTSDFLALPVREITFTIETPGNYKIAFFNKGASVTLHSTYIVALDGEGGGTVTPDPGTDPDDPTVDPDDPNTDPDDPTVDPDDPGTDPTPEPEEPLEKIDLPFAHSFAGASFGGKWQTESSGDKGVWSAVEVQHKGVFLGDWQPQDGDGGMASYDGANSDNGDWARLITAPITKSSSTAPVVDFWFRHSHQRGCKNYLKVQVQADGGEWQDVDNAKIQIYIPEYEDGEWVNYVFPLDAYTGGCETYRVAFTGYTDGISSHLVIDNVNIYNMADKDVNIVSTVLPEEVAAGNYIEIAVTLENMGGTTLQPEDYSVDVEGDYPFDFTFEKVAVPSLERGVVYGRAKVTAEEVLNGPEYEFTVKVNVPGNQSAETLESDKLETEIVFVDHTSPLSPSATTGENGTLNFSWGSVKDLNHKSILIAEDFNSLPAREQIEVDGDRVWKDGAKGNFNGFVSIDLDKQDGGSYYSTSGSEFQVFKDFMTGSFPQGHSGQYIGLTTPGNIQQDDWLISPELDATSTSVLNLQMKIAYIHRESDSYNNSLEVLYSTEDYNKNNPSESFKHSLYSNTSKATSGDLPHDGLYHWLRVNNIPAEAKYVAVHFNTKSAMQTGTWVDLISITENDLAPLTGYYVYLRNFGRLNETPLSPEQLSYTVSKDPRLSDLYYVTALYKDGESAPAEFHGESSGVSAFEQAESTGEARYYNLQGVEVKNPQTGSILIRVKNGKAEKVIM